MTVDFDKLSQARKIAVTADVSFANLDSNLCPKPVLIERDPGKYRELPGRLQEHVEH